MDQINKAKAAAENIDDEWAAHLTTARATPYQTVKLRRLRFTVWYSVRVAQPVVWQFGHRSNYKSTAQKKNI